jgi:hypothetical protein
VKYVAVPPASRPKAAEMKEAQTANVFSSESALTHYLALSLSLRLSLIPGPGGSAQGSQVPFEDGPAVSQVGG